MRWHTLALMTAAGSALAAAGAEAQVPGAGNRADLRLYAAGLWTSPWLETQAGTTFGIGLNPGFGGAGSYWLTPRLGARLHVGFMPSNVPQPSTEEPFGPGGPPPGAFDAGLDNWLYDVSLAVRPFARPGQAGNALSSLYLFVGGGGFSPNPPHAGDCVHPYTIGNACLPTDWRDATVLQLTTGAGATLIPLTRTLGLFTEAAAHFYSSPFQPADVQGCNRPECMTAGRAARAVRLAGGLLLSLGQPRPPGRAWPAPPPPPMAGPAPAGLPEPTAADGEPIRVCAVVAGVPRYLEAFVRAPGDTIVITEQGIRRPLRAAHPMPAPSATGQDWFARNESVFFAAQEYVPSGAPRQIEPLQLQRIGVFQSVPLFAHRDAGTPPPSIFVPMLDGCTFQPHQLRPRLAPRR